MTNYTIERSRRRSLTLSIRPDGQIVVKAPHLVPKMIIDQFVSKHQDWIDKRLERLVQAPHVGSRKYTDGEVFLYLGKHVTLTLGNYTTISVQDEKLLFPKALQFRAQKELQAWYMKQGQELITKQLERYATEMGASYNDLMYSDTRSKWGSCSHDNKLQFSWRLIMAPLLVMNYVIIHELAHTTEKNHSRDFWRRVEKYTPSYRQSRKWLRENGHTLTF